MKRSLQDPSSLFGWQQGTLFVAVLFLASAPVGGCSPSDDAGSSQPADEEYECYMPPRTETCENGGGTRRCYSYSSFYPWWPPITGGGGTGSGGTGSGGTGSGGAGSGGAGSGGAGSGGAGSGGAGSGGAGSGGAGSGGAGELPYCPPTEVLLKTQQQGACGYNLVEVCSEAEQEGEECCYDTIHYAAGACCG